MTEALLYYRLEGKILLADREYIGEKWLRYLCSEGIDCAGSPVCGAAQCGLLPTAGQRSPRPSLYKAEPTGPPPQAGRYQTVHTEWLPAVYRDA